MNDTNNIDISEWLNYAESDLHFAKWGMQDEVPAAHIICFLCQSSAEKHIKSLLLLKGWRLKKTHDLIYLANIAKAEFGIDLEYIIPSLLILNEYIEETRYPGDYSIEAFTLTMAKEAIMAATDIQEFITKLINNGSNHAEGIQSAVD